MDERTAIITGAGSGVGRASAVALAHDGWALGLCGRRPEQLEATAALVDDAGGRSLVVTCDVAQPDEVEALFVAVNAWAPRLDLLFNNAGIGAPAVAMEDLDLADWSAVLAVNLTGAFLCSQHAMRKMKSQQPSGGRIINNGSISAHVPRPNSAPYTATKHALTGLTKSIALDGRASGITCGQIDIGNAATPMTEAASEGLLQPDGSVRAEPTMDSADVGRAVAYMASLPADAMVLTMTVMAAAMPYVGRG